MSTTSALSTTTESGAAAISQSAAAMSELFNPANRANPYGPTKVLRELAPLHRSPLGVHLVTRYADCSTILRDASWSHAGEAALLHSEIDSEDVAAELPTSFVWMDPPDHTRLRALVAKGFTARMVAGLRPRIEELVLRLIDEALAAGDIDLIQRVAYPLPLTVICELIGIPRSDHQLVQGWSQHLARGFDPDVLMEPDAKQARSTAASELFAYFRRLITERRRRPADDLLSALGAVEDAGDMLSATELLATCVTILVAGHETTVNLIGNGLLALLRNPDQLQRLRERPELIHSAVEELLRFEPPIQMTTRTATRDITLAGHDFSPNNGVVVLLNSANRDPAAFADPDRLDVGRTHDRTGPRARHLTFGLGIHYCLGAPLAVLQMEVLLRRLTERVPVLELTSARPQYRPNLVFRGLSSLPVCFKG